MSSSEVSLLQIPEIPMKHILEYLDFPSILILRKTCHDLRNFIDDTEPASHLTEIYVKVYPESIRFSVYCDQSIAAGALIRIMTDIDYKKNGEGCLINCNQEGKIKETILENEDFATVFCKDLDTILRHQKTELRYFESIFNSPNSRVKERILESVNKSLKSLNHPLQVRTIVMKVNNHSEILPILPYIDPKPLQTIYISEYETENGNSVLNLNEISQLVQWKQANNLVITGFQVPYLSQNLKHFSKINLGLREVSIEELLLLKEIFLCSSTLNKISVDYNFNVTEDIKPKLIEAFGQPFHYNRDQDSWFFRIPDTIQFLRITIDEYSIDFDRIEQSNVPQNAIISN